MTINLDFRKNLVYEVTAPTTTILQDINEIAIIDKKEKTRYKFLTRLLIGSIFAAAGLFCLLIFLIILIPSIFLIFGGLVFIGLVITAVYLGLNLPSELNIQTKRYELVKQLLKMLERDLDDDSLINIHLVLSSPTEKSKCINTVPHPKKIGFKVDSFKDDWLSIQGQFLDKTKFTLNATEFYQTKYGWKTSISGKSKHKSKSKLKGAEITSQLTYPQRRYGAIKVLQSQAIDAVKLPERVLVKRLRVMDKNIDLTTKVPPELADSSEYLYQTITMMYLSLYQVLNLAKLLSKKKEVSR